MATKGSAIDHLPDEILHEILVHVADADPGDLVAVVRASRRLHGIASPLLSRNFPGHRGWDPEGWAVRLIRDPSLRPAVRSVRLAQVPGWAQRDEGPAWLDDAGGGGDGDDGLPRPAVRLAMTSLTLGDVEVLVRAARERVPELFDAWNWEEQLRRGVPDAVLAVVFAWATELEELDLEVPWFARGGVGGGGFTDADNDLVILQLVKHVAGVAPGSSWSPPWASAPWATSPSSRKRLRIGAPRSPTPPKAPLARPLDKLRSVTLRHWDTELSMEGAAAAPFFRLPSLRRFRGVMMEANDLVLDQVGSAHPGNPLHGSRAILFPDGTSAVEEVLLEDCNIWDNGVRVLTQSCRRLRRLELRWGEGCYGEDGVFSCAEVADAVRRHSDSLEVFLIDATVSNWMLYAGGSPGLLGDCFHSCRVLRRLTVQGCLLWDGGDHEAERGQEQGDNNGNRADQDMPDADGYYAGQHRGDLVAPRPAGIAGMLPPSLESLTLISGLGCAAPHDFGRNAAHAAQLVRHCGRHGVLPRLRRLDLYDWVDDTEYDDDDVGKLKAAAAAAGVKLVLRAVAEGPTRLVPSIFQIDGPAQDTVPREY